MGKPQREKPKGELCYYLTLFKIEGHQTWRANLSGNKNAFDAEWSKQANPPKITDKMVTVIDRITGTFKS